MANKPNNPSLWSKAKSLAKQKFDVYPSAYANGWAAKWYKSKGGTWSKAEYGGYISEDLNQDNMYDMNNILFDGYIPQDYFNTPYIMQEGGIPERYKNMGFSRVGQKKDSTSEGKKWMVLAKKGDDYKVVHGGYDGMEDYTQHRSEQRRENFWNRMGGKDSAKARDPFSPLYWHKRFGTWADGGETYNLPMAQEGWVQRAANANLRAWEKCRMSQGKDCAAVFGTSPSGKSYKDVYSSLSDIDAYDRDQRKMFKQTLPQGVSLEDWTAFNREANRLNAVFNNPDYDKYFDPQGALKPEYENIATNFEPYTLFYKPAFMNKKRVSPTDIMNFHMNQPYGILGYKDLVNKGYRLDQKKKGGSTFSGNAWYEMGGQPLFDMMTLPVYQNAGTVDNNFGLEALNMVRYNDDNVIYRMPADYDYTGDPSYTSRTVAQPQTPSRRSRSKPGSAVIDYNNVITLPRDIKTKTRIAAAYGLTNYSGTPEEDMMLRQAMATGTPITPTTPAKRDYPDFRYNANESFEQDLFTRKDLDNPDNPDDTDENNPIYQDDESNWLAPAIAVGSIAGLGALGYGALERSSNRAAASSSTNTTSKTPAKTTSTVKRTPEQLKLDADVNKQVEKFKGKSKPEVSRAIKSRGYRLPTDYNLLQKLGFTGKQISEVLDGLPFRETMISKGWNPNTLPLITANKYGLEGMLGAMDDEFQTKYKGSVSRKVTAERKLYDKAMAEALEKAKDIIDEAKVNGLTKDTRVKLSNLGFSGNEVNELIKGLKFSPTATAPVPASSSFWDDAAKVIKGGLQKAIRRKFQTGGEKESNFFDSMYNDLSDYNILDHIYQAATSPSPFVNPYRAIPRDVRMKYGIGINPLNKIPAVKTVADIGQYWLPFYGSALAMGQLGTALGSNKMDNIEKGQEILATGIGYGAPLLVGKGVNAAKKVYNNRKKEYGGVISVGQEMEVSPEQLEQLRKQGYNFEII